MNPQHGYLECINLLSQAGANINARIKDGWTALHIAVDMKSLDGIRALLAAGASLDIRNNDGDTALDIAMKKDYMDAIKVLDMKTNIDESRLSLDELETKNPNELIEMLHDEISKEHSNISYIKELIEVGCPIDIYNNWGCTPLHWAAEYRKDEIITLFLTIGLDINARDQSGKTPLFHAAKNSDAEVSYSAIDMLINNGAEVDAIDKYGNTPLHVAAAVGNIDTLLLLMRISKSINAQNIDGSTPLHLAVFWENYEAVFNLIHFGAKLDIFDNEKNTPWDMAGDELREFQPELNPDADV